MKQRPIKEDGLNLMMRIFETGSQGAGILQQEAVGQQSFVNSTTLPIEMQGDTKSILSAVGVKFLEVVEGDTLFQYVELPEGWHKKAAEHSMWSHLIDDKGRQRANIFYKAAYYDRSAHISAIRRYSYGTDYEQSDDEFSVAHAKDGNVVIFTTEPVKGDSDKSCEHRKQARKQAKTWLNENYPDWENAAAYWD